MQNYYSLFVLAALSAPWLFLIVLFYDKRRQERLWRETLVYLKSSSAYEAEDQIDRIHRREKTLIEKGLAKMKKEGENLAEGPMEDMATDMRELLQKQYDIGT